MGLEAGCQAAVEPTATVRLVDKRRRIVEVVGPRPAEWPRPKLLLDTYGLAARGQGDRPPRMGRTERPYWTAGMPGYVRRGCGHHNDHDH